MGSATLPADEDQAHSAVSGGLGELLQRFQQNGYGNVAGSWLGTGPNQSIAPHELQQALGASYEISPRLSAGVELLHEFIFPDWRDNEKIRNVFVGPNVSYRHGNWFVTATALTQATDTPDERDFQLRTIFGIGL